MNFIDWLRRPRGKVKSNGVSVVTNPDTEDSFTLGFIGFKSKHGFIEVEASKKLARITKINAFSCCDGKPVRPGGEVDSEILYFQHENKYPRCLDEYADLVSSTMKPKFWDYVPFGYCTWYYYFHKITEKETLKNLELATDKEFNPYFSLDYFQLDDGYQFTQGQCGDWKNYNREKFPHGFKKIVDAINQKKLIPGLWLAPFNAKPNSDLALAHPDWILKDVSGKKLKPTFISFRFQNALDPTNPDVKKHLDELFKYFIKEIGFDYIKIDFIFSAITEDAVFFNEDITRIEAYREGLQVLREAAGEERFILGCGAPLMETIGMVNGMRISADTAPKWAIYDFILSGLNLITSGMKYALLNTITRSWMHKKFWLNDPDCLLVRTENSKLTQEEVKTELSILGLSGGQIAISEDFEQLDQESMKMISLVQPISPEPAYSPDMFVSRYPRIYMINGDSTVHGEWMVVALINWEGKKTTLEMNLGKIGCKPKETYHITDFWERKYLGTFLGDETITFEKVPKHGCKLLRITKHLEGAQLLGTTLHVLQGMLEVTQFSFDIDKSEIRIGLEKFGLNEGIVYVKLPARYFIKEPTGEGFHTEEVKETIYKITVSFDGQMEILLPLEIA